MLNPLVNCRRRRLWIYKTFPDIPCVLQNFSRGLAILLVHEEEEITLVELEREIMNCPLRTDSTSLK